MYKNIIRYLLALVSILVVVCISAISVSAVTQGTNGDEMQIMQPEKLEIQLGAEWSGVEFQLKTDVGLYPGTVKVGTDGVLRMEIGGSSKYILSCLGSAVSVPKPSETATSTDTSQALNTTESKDNNKDGTIAGIPIAHIIVFAGGMTISIGTLIVLKTINKNKNNTGKNDEDEDE